MQDTSRVWENTYEIRPVSGLDEAMSRRPDISVYAISHCETKTSIEYGVTSLGKVDSIDEGVSKIVSYFKIMEKESEDYSSYANGKIDIKCEKCTRFNDPQATQAVQREDSGAKCTKFGDPLEYKVDLGDPFHYGLITAGTVPSVCQ